MVVAGQAPSQRDGGPCDVLISVGGSVQCQHLWGPDVGIVFCP